MEIHAVLADTGRPAGFNAVNLLNAGWTVTTGMPLPDGGYTLPGQALTVFLQAPWHELNRPYRMVMELVDDEGQLAQLSGGVGMQPARIEQEVVVPPVPGAPNGIPGMSSVLVDLPSGSLRIAATRRRYAWRVTVGDDVGETGFWVNSPASGPVIGAAPPQ